MGFIDKLADKLNFVSDANKAARVAKAIKFNAEEEAKRRAGEPARPARCPYCVRLLAGPDDNQCRFCGQEWCRDPKAETPKATSRSESSNSYRDPKAEEPKATSQSPHPLSPEQARLLLGLGKTFSADELKSAWKRKVSEWHPDKLDGMAEELRKLATQRVQSLNEAYALLRN